MDTEPARILVVDDDPTNRLKISMAVRALGYTVEQAEDGRQALEMLPEGLFDLMLLDIVMPRMNGYEVLTALKHDSNLPSLPVIVISAVDDIESVVEAIKLGAEDYLPKTFNPVLLKARVETCIEKKRLRDAATELLGRLEGELQEARQAQLNMVPQEFPPATSEHPVLVHAMMEPAREVGGDFYDFFYLGKDTLCFVVGDVSDKGAAAGMFMARARSLTRFAPLHWYRSTGRLPNPAEILTIINSELCDCNPEMQFVTVLFGYLNLRTGEVDIVNAGHASPYRICGDGPVEIIATSRNHPLGIRADSRYVSDKLTLSPNQCLFIYTDGVPDAVNHAGDSYSDNRLVTNFGSLASLSPAVVIEQVRNDVFDFVGDTTPFDDITMLAIQWLSHS